MDELITPLELYQRLASDNPPVVIDTRNAALYKAGHLAGALNIRPDSILRNLDRIPRDKLVVTY